ncbi:thermonuclease family protein [Nocardioides pelophilus]|uniref:thermonuclease family protein n=1 Tax=Nocardioides pelophilus TaxID=2172019 RepID=UPI001604A0C1|nr:thermonuclease family protein [Nocardioides pelophilus]
MRRAGAAILALVLGLPVAACSDLAGSADRREERREERREHRAEQAREEGRDKGRDKGPGQRSGPTYLVTWVVDGDTLELGNGERVRLLGIDTPEVGECGYEKARDRLVALVEGERVTLGEGDVDRDRYDRLLRYVDLGPLDAGLRLLEDGLAIARYDSRDGYGFHPREPAYIKADRGAPNLTCAPAPRRFAPNQPSGCAPGYSPCVPVYPPDVDCSDVDGPISVTGSDPHGLDADGDHVACEWG